MNRRARYALCVGFAVTFVATFSWWLTESQDADTELQREERDVLGVPGASGAVALDATPVPNALASDAARDRKVVVAFVGPDRQPVGRVTVTILRHPFTNTSSSARELTGEFSVIVKPPESIVLRVQAINVARDELHVAFRDEEATGDVSWTVSSPVTGHETTGTGKRVEIELFPAASLEGFVTSLSGEPCPNLEVVLSEASDEKETERVVVTAAVTGPNGRFRLSVPAGIEVRLLLSGYALFTEATKIPILPYEKIVGPFDPEEIHTENFTVELAAEIHATVLLPDSESCKNIRCRYAVVEKAVEGERGVLLKRGTTEVHKSCQFTIGPIRSVSNPVLVGCIAGSDSPGRAAYRGEANLSELAPGINRIALSVNPYTPPSRVAARVFVSDDRGLPLEFDGADVSWDVWVLNSHGKYSLLSYDRPSNVFIGFLKSQDPHSVWVRVGSVFASQDDVFFADTDEFQFMFPTWQLGSLCTLHVKLRSADPRLQRGLIEVALNGVPGGAFSPQRIRNEAMIPFLAPGIYRVLFHGEKAFVGVSDEVELTPGGVHPLTIDIEPSRTLNCTLQGVEESDGPTRVVVSGYTSSGRLFECTKIDNRSKTTVSFDAVPPGTYHCFGSRGSSVFEWTPVTAHEGQEEYNVVMNSTSAASTVTLEWSDAKLLAFIEVRQSDGSLCWRDTFGEATLQPKGYSFPLPPGRYELVYFFHEKKPAWQKVQPTPRLRQELVVPSEDYVVQLR